jgi:hypothetical protein
MATKANINLKVFSVQGYDFRYAFTAIDIYEDINKNTYSGTCDVMETEGVREAIPFIGEEVGVIQFSSRSPESGVDHETIQFIFRINKLEHLREGTSIQKRYRLHFTSLNHEVNINQRVRKHYKGTADAVVGRLVKAHFGGELITTDACKHEQDFVFPNWSPFQCINYLSTISVSSKYTDPYYKFYEDRDGFHFVSLSKLMSQGPVETIDMQMANTKLQPDETWDRLQMSTYTVEPLFDTLDNYYSGMYGNTVLTYNKITKRYTETKRTYSDTYGDFKHVGKEKLTRTKSENPKGRFQFIMNNNPEHPGVYSHVDDWGNKILNRAGQMRNNRIHIFVNGKTNVKVGNVIRWDFRSSIEGKEKDDILSGNYLITKIRHLIRPGMYNMNMEIIKDGLG